jgi:hypothetical protein
MAKEKKKAIPKPEPITKPELEFTVRGRSFNAHFIAGKTEGEFIAYGKKQWKDSSFFGQSNDAQQTELLKDVYKQAKELVNGPEKQAPPPAPPPAK